MPEPLVEGRLQFDFPESWLALKFDDTAWYRDAMRAQVKAVDVVACSAGIHWWVEVKDCRSFETANLPRLSPNDPSEVTAVREWAKLQGHREVVSVKRAKPFIVDEVAEKVEGTLLSLVAAVRKVEADARAATVLPFAQVRNQGGRWCVVLLLTWDPTARDFGRLAMRLNDKLRQRLAAYQLECFVVNEEAPAPHQPWQLTRIA